MTRSSWYLTSSHSSVLNVEKLKPFVHYLSLSVKYFWLRFCIFPSVWVLNPLYMPSLFNLYDLLFLLAVLPNIDFSEILEQCPV